MNIIGNTMFLSTFNNYEYPGDLNFFICLFNKYGNVAMEHKFLFNSNEERDIKQDNKGTEPSLGSWGQKNLPLSQS